MHTEWHRLSGSRVTPMRTLIGAFGAIIAIVAVANVYAQFIKDLPWTADIDVP